MSVIYTGTPSTLVAGDTSALVTKFNDHRDALKALSEAWTSYTPTWTGTTNPAIGNGTLVGAYRQVNKAIEFRVQITMGSTTTYGTGNWGISLPVAAHTAYTVNMVLGEGLAVDVSAPAFAPLIGGMLTSAAVYLVTAAGTIAATGIPYTWATGDKVSVTGSYEAA